MGGSERLLNQTVKIGETNTCQLSYIRGGHNIFRPLLAKIKSYVGLKVTKNPFFFNNSQHLHRF